jgi:hypothetical protein
MSEAAQYYDDSNSRPDYRDVNHDADQFVIDREITTRRFLIRQIRKGFEDSLAFDAEQWQKYAAKEVNRIKRFTTITQDQALTFDYDENDQPIEYSTMSMLLMRELGDDGNGVGSEKLYFHIPLVDQAMYRTLINGGELPRLDRVFIERRITGHPSGEYVERWMVTEDEMRGYSIDPITGVMRDELDDTRFFIEPDEDEPANQEENKDSLVLKFIKEIRNFHGVPQIETTRDPR